jgi:glycine dehydrogenase subunit 1
VVKKLTAAGIVPGLALSRFFPDRTHDLLVCVTENNTKAQIDSLVAELGKCSN